MVIDPEQYAKAVKLGEALDSVVMQAKADGVSDEYRLKQLIASVFAIIECHFEEHQGRAATKEDAYAILMEALSVSEFPGDAPAAPTMEAN